MSGNREDHLALAVKNPDTPCPFYAKVLGMEVVTFPGGRKVSAFGSQKINLHEEGNGFEPKAEKPTPGSADICFITDVPLSEAMGHLRSGGVSLLDGPAERTGAGGPFLSAHFRGPDGNLVEPSNDRP